jgi:EAL domain-containing protein (putative c-di-GMP-specific phosphodiesterase class I)
MDNKDNRQDYVSVAIKEGFYFNQNLGLPTVIKEYEKIEKILVDSQYLACLTIQIDQLSKIEYLYGSLTYNNLLVCIAETLKRLKEKEFRKNDIFVVDIFDVDTFIIFLSAPRDQKTKILDNLEDVADRIRVNLEEKIFGICYPYLKKYFKMRIGFALVIKNPMVSNMRLIMQLANEAKKMGEFVSVKQGDMAKFKLQKIIIKQTIHTVFQPVVDLQSLEVIGYEALSRGPRNTEFANPLRLFIIAAECGLSFELDRLCRRKAFECVRHMKTDKKIFVNTLTMTIHDPEFRGEYLKELLEDLKIKPENVVFEISEKLAIDNYELFRIAMKDYSDIGIVHADDDSGRGYSDLERLMELKPGYLKIDMSFVRDIDKSYIKQEIIKAMVNLTNSLGSVLIAEGIETKEEYEKLKDMNVKFGQGFLFAKPSEGFGSIRKDF